MASQENITENAPEKSHNVPSPEIVVQVNGRVRAKLKVPVGLGQEEVVKLARQDAGVASYLEGKRILKVIYVQDKLLNLVIG